MGQDICGMGPTGPPTEDLKFRLTQPPKQPRAGEQVGRFFFPETHNAFGQQLDIAPSPTIDNGFGGLGDPLEPFDFKPRSTPHGKADGFEFADGTRQEVGTFRKRMPFVKGQYRFKRGDRIRIHGREHEVLHVEPFPEGRSYVHARSAAGDIQEFFPDSEIHAA